MGTKFIGNFTLLNPLMKSNFILKGVSQTLFFVKNLTASLMLTVTLLIFGWGCISLYLQTYFWEGSTQSSQTIGS
jgi:hypothetical protein